MKKLFLMMLALALCVCLCACDQLVPIMPGTDIDGEDVSAVLTDGQTPEDDVFLERPFYEFMGWDRLADTYYDNTPVAVSRQVYGDDVTAGYTSPVFDRASIIAACDALRGMTITGTADAAPAAEAYILTMADGTQYVLQFAGDDLVMTSGNYTVSGAEALRSIQFPGYSEDFDMFDLYFSDSIRAFADGFYEDTPVSVGRRMNQGATLTSTDPDVVERAFSLLANATVSYVEMSPDQNIDLTQTTDYVFTLESGDYYTFSFTGPCLAVTASSAYGTVYYWLDGIDELSSLTILPESTAAVFEGGAITGVREDIQRAADVLNGEVADLTLSGIFVDFTIDGNRAYLTLDGDTATSFLRQVLSITATAETVEEASGDVITVSVTLSDGSGPIIYFTGDTIQQMVGTNFVCDSDAMASLRDTVLELAQDERNIGQLAESTTE